MKYKILFLFLCGVLHYCFAEDHYSKNFNLYFDEKTKTFNVTVVSPLTEGELKNAANVILTLTANADGGSGTSLLPKPTTITGLEFTNLNYLANYVIDGNGKGKDSVEPDGPSIEFSDIAGKPKLTILEEEWQKNFVANFDTETNTVNVEVSENLEKYDKPEIAITIEAELDGTTGVATLVINLAPEDWQILEFSSYNYLGNYTVNKNDGSDSINIDGAITFTTEVSNVKLTILEKDYADYIVANFNEVTKIISIDVLNKLPEDNLEKTEIILTIEAETDDARGVATLVVNMPKSSIYPKFTKAFYSGVYNIWDDTVSIFANNPIAIASGDPEDTEVTVIGEFEKNFLPWFSEGKWAINVTVPLDQKLLDGNKEIVATLQAFIYGSSSTAALIISLPRQDIKPAPEFSKAFYLADYIDDNIAMEGDSIQISSNPSDFVEVTIKDNPFPNNIRLERDSNNESIWNVVVNKPLDLSDLSGDIYLELEANQPETVDNGYATLVVRLPSTPTLRFTENVYTAIYQSDSPSIEPATPIQLDGVSTSVKPEVTVDTENQKYFSVQVGEEGAVTLQLLDDQPLPDDVLTQTILIVTINATATGFKPASASVIVELPGSEATPTLHFTENVYTEIYKSDPPSVEPITLIQLDGVSTGVKPEVTVDTENQKYFSVQVGEEGAVTLQLLDDQPLPDDVLTQTILIVTINATATGFKPASASVIVELPGSEATPTLHFTENVYTEIYKSDPPSVEPITLIQLDGVSTGVKPEVTVDTENQKYFSVQVGEEGAVTLQLLDDQPLPDDVLTQTILIVTINATATGFKPASASVIVELPGSEATPALHFTENVYTEIYKSDPPSVEPITLIQLDGVSTGVKPEVTVDTENQKYFSVQVGEEGAVTLQLSDDQPLPDDVLTQPILIVTISATATGFKPASASVIVELPGSEATPSLHFTENVYTEIYKSDPPSVEPITSIQLDGVSTGVEAEVTVDTENQKYFSVQVGEKGAVTLQLLDGQPLPDDVLTQTILIVTINATATGFKPASASVIVELPGSEATPTLHFTENVYTEIYKSDPPSVEPITLIQLDGVSTGVKPEVTVDTENQKYFSVQVGEEGAVTLQLLDDQPLPDDVLTQTILIVTINATATGFKPASASVIVELPGSEATPALHFTENVYTEIYKSDPPSVEPITLIQLDGVSTGVKPEVTVDTENQKYFSVQVGEEGAVTLQLSDDQPLPDDVLTQPILIVTISATATGFKPASASVIVELPGSEATPSLHFTENVYTEIYKSDPPSVEPITSIQLDGVSTGVEAEVTVDTENQKYFSVQVGEKGAVTLQLLDGQPLPDDVLTQPILIVTINATATGFKPASASVIVELPGSEATPTLHFTENVYTEIYKSDPPSVEPITSIQLDGVLTGVKPEVTIDTENQKYFSVQVGEEGAVTLQLLDDQPLPDDVLTQTILIVTINATATGFKPASASVIVELPGSEATPTLHFTENVYTEIYKSDPPSVEPITLIQLDGVSTGVKPEVTVDTENQKYFSVQVGEEGAVTLQLSDDQPLPDDVLTQPILIVTISATATGFKPASASVIVELPGSEATPSLHFMENVYTEIYKSDPPSVEPITLIQLDGVSTGVKPEVTIDTENQKYFSVQVGEKGAVTLQLLDGQPLPDDVLTQPILIVTINATATGFKPASASVIVELPGSEATPTLHFTENVYTEIYKSDPPSVEPITLIQLDGVSTGVKPEVTVDTENQKYFSVQVGEEGAVTLQLLDDQPLPDDVLMQTILIVTINATATGFKPASASVIVELPGSEATPTLHFTENVYTEIYKSDPPSVEPITLIQLDGVSTGVKPEVTVDTENQKYFSVQVGEEGAVTLQLSDDQPLPDDVLTQPILIVTISATATGFKPASASVIVELPGSEATPSLHFTENVYTEIYKSDPPSVEPITSIQLDGVSTGVEAEVTVDTENQKYFSVQVGEKGAVTLQLLDGQPLPDDVLTQPILIVTINATATGFKPASASVIVELPGSEATPTLHFTENVYTEIYKSDPPSVEPITLIQLDGVSTGVKPEVTINTENQKYFSVQVGEEGAVTLQLLDDQPLPDDVLTQTILIVTINATATGFKPASASVIVELPGSEATPTLHFTENIYTEIYKSDPPSVEPIRLIQLDGVSTGVKPEVTIDTENQKYFSVQVGEEGAVTLQLLDDQSLPDDVLTQTILIVTINATATGFKPASASVIVELPGSEATPTLHFTENVYTEIYKSDPPSVEPITSIQLDGVSTGVEAEVTVDTENQKYFSVEVGEEGAVTLQLLNDQPLPDNVLTQPILIVTINATATGFKPASASVIVELPGSEATPTLHFTENVYTEIYKSDPPSVEPITSIQLDGVSTGVKPEVTVDTENQKYFSVQVGEEGAVTLQLLNDQPLPDNVLTQPILIVTISATATGFKPASASVIVELPGSEATPTLHFTENVYTEIYKSDPPSVEPITSIQLDGVSTGVKPEVTVDTENQKYFSVQVGEKGAVTLQLLDGQPLPDDVLTQPILIVTISATATGFKPASASVIVELPGSEATPSLHFTENVYTEIYKSDPPSVEPITLIQLDGVSTGVKPEVTVDTENQKYFSVQVGEEGTVTLQLLDDQPLPDDVLTQTILIVTINATATGFKPASASVIVELPGSEATPTLHFTENVYTEIYKSDPPSVEPITLIQLDGVSTGVKPEVTVDTENQKYFSVQIGEEGAVTLQLLDDQPLPDDVLTQTILIVTINATATGFKPASASVIVELPGSEATPTLHFTENVYTEIYKSDPPSVEPITSIQLDGVSTGVEAEVTVDTENQKYFSVEVGEEGAVTLQLLNDQPLPDNVLTQPILIVTISATATGFKPASASVIVELPGSEATPSLHFTENVYTEIYKGDPPSVEPITSIQLDGVSTGVEAEVTVDTENQKYFSVQVGEKGAVTLQLLDGQPLPDDVLTQPSLIVTISATATGFKPASASVIVELPGSEATPSLHFTENVYTEIYKSDPPSVEPITLIQLDGVSTGVKPEVTVDTENQKYFSVQVGEEGAVTLQLLNDQPLPDDVLTQTILIVTINATATGFKPASASVIVELPGSEATPTLHFTENVYTEIYKSDPPSVEPITSIQLDGVLTGVEPEVTVDTENQKYFSVQVGEKGAVTLQLLNDQPLPDDVLTLPILIVTINAIATGFKPASASVIVELPGSEVTPTLHFSENVYTEIYKSDPPSVEPIISIQLDGVLTGVEPEVTVDTENQKYFSVQIGEKGAVTLQLLNDQPLPDDVLTLPILIVTINAIATGFKPASASVIVELPGSEVTPTLHFSENVYIEIYKSDPPSVEPITSIQLDGVLTGVEPEVTVDTENQKYFSVQVGEKGAVTLQLLNDQPLPDDVLTLPILIVTINAIATGFKPASASVVVELPSSGATPTIRFTEDVYIAIYHDDPPSLEPLAPIQVLGDLTDVELEITLDPESQKYFTVEIDEKFAITLQLSNNNPLPDDILEQSIFIVTINATESGLKKIASTSVVMELHSRQATPMIRFDSNVYTAEYVKNTDTGRAIIKQLDEITLEGDGSDVTVGISGDNSGLFKAKHENGKVTVTLMNDDLPYSIIDGNNGAILVIIIATKGHEMAESTLIVTLPKSVVSAEIYFSQNVYEAEYSEIDGSGKIELDSGITVAGNGLDGVKITIDTADEDYFNVSSQLNGEIINVAFDLTGEKLLSTVTSNKAAIIATIVAEKNNVSVSAAVIVKLPNTQLTTIHFTRNVYTAEYTEDEGGVGYVTLAPDLVTLTGGDLTGAQITLEDDNGGFEAELDNYSGVVTFKVTKGHLPEDILKYNGVVTVTVVATKADDTVRAAVVVKLPRPELSSIRFTSNVYTAEYTEDGKFNPLENISITGADLTGVNVVTDGEYKDYFDAKYNPSTGKVTVTLSNGLPGDVLQGYEAAIGVTVVATKNDESVSTSIVVTLPKKVVPTSFKFSSNVYSAEYKKEDGDEEAKIFILDDVKIKGEGLGDIAVTLTGNEKEYFDVNYDGKGGVTVNLTKPLSASILNGYDAVVTVTIVAKKGDEEVQSSLVVTLPKEVVPTSFKFSLNVYTAQYVQNDDDDKIEPGDKMTIVGDGIEDITVALAGENSDNFGVSYDKRGTVTVTLKDSLPSNIINGDQAAVTVTLVGTKGDEVVEATLVVTLPKHDGEPNDINKDITPYIIAISIVSVLLAAALIGAIAFYFLVIRHRDHDRLDEYD